MTYYYYSVIFLSTNSLKSLVKMIFNVNCLPATELFYKLRKMAVYQGVDGKVRLYCQSLLASPAIF
jgi:hypothetical protein